MISDYQANRVVDLPVELGLTTTVMETGDGARPPTLLATAATKRKQIDSVIANARMVRPRHVGTLGPRCSLDDSIRRLLL